MYKNVRQIKSGNNQFHGKKDNGGNGIDVKAKFLHFPHQKDPNKSRKEDDEPCNRKQEEVQAGKVIQLKVFVEDTTKTSSIKHA